MILDCCTCIHQFVDATCKPCSECSGNPMDDMEKPSNYYSAILNGDDPKEHVTIIAVDFDGTLHGVGGITYPGIGRPNLPLIQYLRSLKNYENAIIILWTCRVGEELVAAVEWCKDNDIPIDYVNRNANKIIEAFGGDGRKIFANEYIDDRNSKWIVGETRVFADDKLVVDNYNVE